MSFVLMHSEGSIERWNDMNFIWWWYDMHMVSIRVRYGFRWHSDKPYRTSRRRVRYGLSECQLNPYRTRMDIICIFSHEITLNLSFTTKKRTWSWNITTSVANHRVRYGVRSELWLTLTFNRGVRESCQLVSVFYVICIIVMIIMILVVIASDY